MDRGAGARTGAGRRGLVAGAGARGLGQGQGRMDRGAWRSGALRDGKEAQIR